MVPQAAAQEAQILVAIPEITFSLFSGLETVHLSITGTAQPYGSK
jgi:hypothetical protein